MKRDIVVIGGSAGSVEPVRELLCSLAENVGAAIFIALHRPHLKRPDPLTRGDRLAWLLSRRIHMEVMVAVDGEAFEHGHVYIAPPQTHMLVEPGKIRIEPFATGQRLTSVDALFQSAAKAYGDRVIGVLLSGMLQDGTAGCWAIRQRGGVTIAQDPNEAEYSSMPRTAMQEVPVDYCLRAQEIAAKLEDLIAGELTPPAAPTARIMIVEDEWLLASELERQLTELGYTVVAVESSGEEALAKAGVAKPDIAIMDVGLAGKIKGTDVATQLWEQFQVPIIFLTAHADQQTLAAAQSSMPYAFLAKPHHAGQLHSAIQLALGRRTRESRNPQSARRIS